MTKTISPETGTIYSREELLTAFRTVEDKEQWKTIDAVIPADQRDVTEAAISFFAGCQAEFTPITPTTLRVQAVCYMPVGAWDDRRNFWQKHRKVIKIWISGAVGLWVLAASVPAWMIAKVFGALVLAAFVGFVLWVFLEIK